MTIEVLNTDGISQIKNTIDAQTQDRDRMVLVLVDCSNTTEKLPSDKMIKWVSDTLSDRHGQITKSNTDMITFLTTLKTGEEVKDFTKKFNDGLPREFFFSIIETEKNDGDVNKVTLVLDFHKDGAEKGLAAQALQEQKTQRLEKRVLVADDDMYIRKLLKSSLKDDFKVFEVDDGSDVEKTYMEHLPDILFLDIHLPNKTGLEIINDIRSQDPHAYIVILSADSVQKNVMEAINNGAKGFMAKPPKRETLDEYIARCPSLQDKP